MADVMYSLSGVYQRTLRSAGREFSAHLFCWGKGGDYHVELRWSGLYGLCVLVSFCTS